MTAKLGDGLVIVMNLARVGLAAWGGFQVWDWWQHGDDVALDARGRIVALARFEGDHDALYRVRPDGTLREVLRLRPMERLDLLTARADGSLLLTGNPGGDFRRVMRLDSNDRLQTLHEDPRGEADLDEDLSIAGLMAGVDWRSA